MMDKYEEAEVRYINLWNFVNNFSQIGLYPTPEEFWKLVEEAKEII